jgi:hypothetical protein
MAYKPLPPQEVLRQLLDYNPDTGILTWKARTPDMFADGRNSPEHRCEMFNRNFAGKEAFIHKNAKGYRVGSVNRSLFLAHRIIWKFVTGCDPRDQIDHINMITDDNRIANLREAEGWQNRGNTKASNRKIHSRFKGVHVARTGAYTASIMLDGKQVHLGSFRCETSAALAYDAWASKKYGEFARVNFPRGAQNGTT